MCGITGVLHIKDRNPIDTLLLKRMTDILSYRGPDGEGFYVDRYIGLGHRRLAIIDLSEKGKQPMSNEDGTIQVVLNGEIYNFKELRKVLEQKGHRFYSETDTEVVVHAYEAFGEDCVNHLRGMFAFAVWDRDRKKLLLARDRFGKKPLFYYYDKKKFIFASELKALLQYEEIPRHINTESISHYLTYGYVPSPSTIFRNIYKLPPASLLTINTLGELKIEQYWDLKFSSEWKLNQGETCERILKELEEATRMRMISDVPLGAFLSGGVDSSAVVAMMSKLSPDAPIKTFSIGFEEDAYNETKYARIVAEQFKTDHKEFFVNPNAIEILPKLVWHYNEPYSDSSALPSYYLAKLTKKHVTVALNGDGGDEAFGGYQRYAAMNLVRKYRKVPSIVRRTFGTLLRIVPNVKTAKKVKRVNAASLLPDDENYASFLYTFDDNAKAEILTTEFQNQQQPSSKQIILNEMKRINGDLLAKSLYADYKRYLPDDLMVKMDIATMANSLEARSPFLDHKFVEFAAALPSTMKVWKLQTKYILKKALSNVLPNEILTREKMGFGVPLDSWFRNDLKNLSYDILLSQRALQRKYFNSAIVRKLLDDHASGKADNRHKIWTLLWLELWHRIYVDENLFREPNKIEKLLQ